MHPCFEAPSEISGSRYRALPRRQRLSEWGFLLFLMPAILFSALPEAHAENHEKWAQASFNVKLEVKPECSIGTTYTLSFPDLVPNMGDVRADATIVFSCTFGSTWTLTMDMGKWQSADSRRMKHESRDIYIPYRLISDPTSGAGNGLITPTPSVSKLCGELKYSDYSGASPGNYVDTVAVTFTPSAGY